MYTSHKNGVYYVKLHVSKALSKKKLLFVRWAHQFLFLILSACGDRIYSSTICFHRRRQSQPRKKLWTFLILAKSGSSCSAASMPASRSSRSKLRRSPPQPPPPSWLLLADLEPAPRGRSRHSFFNANSWFRIGEKKTLNFLLCV